MLCLAVGQGQELQRYNELQHTYTSLSTNYSNNLVAATAAFKLLVTDNSQVSIPILPHKLVLWHLVLYPSHNFAIPNHPPRLARCCWVWGTRVLCTWACCVWDAQAWNLCSSMHALVLQVAGLPPSTLSQTAQRAQKDGHIQASADAGPWLLTIDDAAYGPIMEHLDARSATIHQSQQITVLSHSAAASVQCPTWVVALPAPPCCFSPQHVLVFRPLREQLYLARVSQASEGPNSNTPIIEQILSTRLESAKLLGYSSYAQLSMASKVWTLCCIISLI